jgi:tetratricopeptide (TPR) repeat protein
MQNQSSFGKSLLIVLLLTALPVCLIPQTAKVKTILDQAEKLHDANDYQGTMAKLREAEKIEPNNPEILWKIARAYFDFADQQPDNPEVQKANVYPGFEYAKKCVELAPNVAGGHQYYSILIGRIGEIEGTKQKITNSYAVREHTEKAIALDPKNDSNYHVMGRWHFALADLSWAERQIASLIYATPPKASFEEAEQFFRKAHELKPNDIRHLLWLGKTQIALRKKDAARKSLQQAMSIPAQSDAEKAMQKEAAELIKKVS